MSNDVELLQQMTSVLELRQWLRDKRAYAMGSANEVGMTRETLQELDNTLGRLMDGEVVTSQPEHVEWQSLLSDPAANQPSRVTEEALRPVTPVSATPQATVNSVDDQADQGDEADLVDEVAEPTAPVDDAEDEDEGKAEPVVVSDTPAELTKMEANRADKTSQAFRSSTASVSDDHDDANDQAGDSAADEPTSTSEEPQESVTDQPDETGNPFNPANLEELAGVLDDIDDGQSAVSQSVDSAIKPTSTDTESGTQPQSNSGIPFDDLLAKGQATPLE